MNAVGMDQKSLLSNQDQQRQGPAGMEGKFFARSKTTWAKCGLSLRTFVFLCQVSIH